MKKRKMEGLSENFSLWKKSNGHSRTEKYNIWKKRYSWWTNSQIELTEEKLRECQGRVTVTI